MFKVFVNCPFDNEYFPILRAFLFTLKHGGFLPLISETIDGGKARIENIIEMMKSADMSIHDISRIELLQKAVYPRFNMPFELGIDIGIKNCEPYTNKKLVIFEKDRYRYQIVLSDISGFDIYHHDNDSEMALKKLRNWLFHYNDQMAAHKVIWEGFQIFDSYYKDTLQSNGNDPDVLGEIPFSEILRMIDMYLENKNTPT